MATSIRSTALADIRKAKGVTQQALADQIGAHWITISKLERGKMEMTYEWASKIARALDVDVNQIMEVDVSKIIDVDGLILDRGRIKLWSDDFGPGQMSYTVFTDILNRRDERWLVVDTEDLYPIFQRGDLIRTTDVDLMNIGEMIHRLAFVEYEDGDGRPAQILGVLTPGPSDGAFDLRPLQGAPLVSIDIKRLARVNMAIFDPWRGGKPSLDARSGES